MKNLLQSLVVGFIAGGMGSCPAAGAPGEENVACESQWPGGDFVQFTCLLTPPLPGQRWHFQADFAGGHDDTSASMKLTLDDVPLNCETGSKTHLYGEDGNVSLVCRFLLPETVGSTSVLGVALLWSHAQYVRTELAADGPGG